jgi:hypothetical protein
MLNYLERSCIATTLIEIETLSQHGLANRIFGVPQYPKFRLSDLESMGRRIDTIENASEQKQALIDFRAYFIYVLQQIAQALSNQPR